MGPGKSLLLVIGKSCPSNPCFLSFFLNCLFFAASVLSCSVWGLHCGGWALCCGACGACASLWLWLSGSRAAGSVVAAHGLSFPEACGILVPRPGIELESSALEGRFLTTGPPATS